MSYFQQRPPVGGLLGDLGIPDYAAGVRSAMAQNAATTPKPKKDLWWLGAIGDAMQAFNGQEGTYAAAMAQKQQAEMAEHQRQLQRAEGREDEIWKRDNLPSAPTQTDRYLAELEDPNTPPQRKALLRQIILRPIGVPVIGQDGSQKTEFYYPDQMPMGQQGGDDEWEYIDEGGAPQGGAPRFR